MPEFTVPSKPGDTLAITACRRILARVASSGDFAWYMNFTECQSLCVQAVAEADGVDFRKLDETIKKKATAIIKKDPPKVERLQKEIDEWEAANEETQDLVKELRLEAENASVEYRLEDILSYCRLTGSQPTVEAIERALKGYSFGSVLMEIS